MEVEHQAGNIHILKCEKCKKEILKIYLGFDGTCVIPMGKVDSFLICGECYEKGDFSRNLR